MSPGDLIAAVRSRIGHPPWTPDDFLPAELRAWRALSPAARQDTFLPAIAQKKRDVEYGPPRRTKRDVA